MTRRITVAAEHHYDVLIGTGVTACLTEHLTDGPRRLLIMTQPGLSEHTRSVRQLLEGAGHEAYVMEVPEAEGAKTADVAASAWQLLGSHNFTRQDFLIGLGGGAVTDLAGFVAATWLRGVDVIQLPTTLLGMVDAAVGGKTGINTGYGKNLVGAFHSPQLVLADLATLATLPPADHATGLAEVVKCGFIADEEILQVLEADGGKASRDPFSPVLVELVQRAISVKAAIVSHDLRETGQREFLNYGHTLAHAIEHVEDFTWRHGDAVAIGMVFAAELARAAGHLDAPVVARHRHVLQFLGLPTRYPPGRWTELHEAMSRDKKTRGDTLRFVILNDVAHPTWLTAPQTELLVAAYDALCRPASDDHGSDAPNPPAPHDPTPTSR